jgi:hypothetical protein
MGLPIKQPEKSRDRKSINYSLSFPKEEEETKCHKSLSLSLSLSLTHTHSQESLPLELFQGIKKCCTKKSTQQKM